MVKGQAFAPDFLASVAVFSVMMTLFLLTWNSLVEAQVSAADEKDFLKGAERTLDTVLHDTENEPGLVTEPMVLNESRLEDFQDLDYGEQAEKLLTPDFRLNVSAETVEYSLGEEPEEAEVVLPLRRDAVIETEEGLERAEVVYVPWR